MIERAPAGKPIDTPPQPGCELAEEFDDQGHGYQACPNSDSGHLYLRGRCLHCGGK